MPQPITKPSDLILTQAEPAPPPAVEVPHPEQPLRAENDCDSETLHEIKRLADRVGGLAKLRDIVDTLMRMPR